MNKLINVVKKITNGLFGVKAVELTTPILKTRKQIISEGRSAYLPKRRIHNSPREL